MVILVDAMGGDNAPDAVIKGAVKAVNEVDSEIMLIGNKDIINSRVKELFEKEKIEDISTKFSIYHTTEVINMEDKPTEVIQTPENTQKVNYYLVSEEGGHIKLYYVDGDETTEIKSEKISLDVLPYDDISILSNGIKTDTADEALAIWENFIS